MSTLHTINKSPFIHNLIDSCLSVCNKNDGILLIEDGVYLAKNNTVYESHLLKAQGLGVALYALSADVAARGLTEQLATGVTLVDYAQFVELTVEHQTVQSWY